MEGYRHSCWQSESENEKRVAKIDEKSSLKYHRTRNSGENLELVEHPDVFSRYFFSYYF